MWFCDAPESSFDYSFAVNRSSRLVSRDVSLKFDTAGPKPDRLACRPSWTGAFLFATSERREWLWRGDVREDSAMDRKKRSRNFSNRDRFLLTDVMKTEVKVIESKRHDGRSNDARKQAWKNDVNAFNARTDEKREEKQLAQLWRDMKRNAKKDHSRFRRQRMGTGGGPEPAPLESLTEEIRRHDPPSVPTNGWSRWWRRRDGDSWIRWLLFFVICDAWKTTPGVEFPIQLVGRLPHQLLNCPTNFLRFWLDLTSKCDLIAVVRYVISI